MSYGEAAYGEVGYGESQPAASPALDITLAGAIQTVVGNFAVTVESASLAFTGTIEGPNGTFTVEGGPEAASLTFEGAVQRPISAFTVEAVVVGADADVTLAGQVAGPTAIFSLEATIDVALAGQVAGPSSSFALEAIAPVELSMAGEVPPVTSDFTLAIAADMTMSGQISPVTGSFDVETVGIAPASLALAGTIAPVTGSFTTEATAALIMFDDFNRANSTNVPGAPVTGGPYTVRTGTWGINSNALYTSVSTSEAHMTFPGGADFDARMKLNVQGSNGGLLFRWIDANNTWLMQWPNTTLLLYRRVAGTWQQMAPTVNRVVSPTDVLRVVALGRWIWVFINNILIWVVEDGFIAGHATSTMGFRFSSETNSRLNEITVYAATSAPSSDGGGDAISLTDLLSSPTFTVGSLYKGRDTKLADEGVEA